MTPPSSPRAGRSTVSSAPSCPTCNEPMKIHPSGYGRWFCMNGHWLGATTEEIVAADRAEYICADPRCGHPYDQHNSVIVPWGCSVVDATSIDCVNGYQGEKPRAAATLREPVEVVVVIGGRVDERSHAFDGNSEGRTVCGLFPDSLSGRRAWKIVPFSRCLSCEKIMAGEHECTNCGGVGSHTDHCVHHPDVQARLRS